MTILYWFLLICFGGFGLYITYGIFYVIFISEYGLPGIGVQGWTLFLVCWSVVIGITHLLGFH